MYSIEIYWTIVVIPIRSTDVYRKSYIFYGIIYRTYRHYSYLFIGITIFRKRIKKTLTVNNQFHSHSILLLQTGKFCVSSVSIIQHCVYSVSCASENRIRPMKISQ